MVSQPELLLPERWRQLHYQRDQRNLWDSSARFNVVEAPRRCGKTEFAMRRGVMDMIEGGDVANYLVLFGGPTRDHAKRIFWEDLQDLIPRKLVASIKESDLEIELIHGPRGRVVGMDEPRRIEGAPIDRGYFDEVAEMKQGTFDRHIRPALSTPGRLGGAWFFGVPRIGHVAGGGKEFKKLADLAKSGKDPEFAYHHWGPDGILDQRELESARATLDPITFAQEYEARRVSASGRAYYGFDREIHAKERLPYKPKNPLLFMFDFNVEPGTATVGQEHRFRERLTERQDRPEVADEITAMLGEVYIPRDSNTPSVCRKLIADWGKHEGPVWCYGDPAGGARTTKLDGEGTDWTVIRDFLKPAFKGGISIRGPGTEQSQRIRVNALNARLRTADGKVHMLIDPAMCPKLIEDFEETTIKPGSDGELHKPSGTPWTHLSDGVGYFAVRAHPITGANVRSEAIR